MNKVLTCYSPYNVNNLYTDNVKRLLREQNIESLSIKECLTNRKKFKECKIFNFNWFENLETQNYFKYLQKVALLNWLRLNRKKIIYTLHNKKPHNLIDGKYSIKIMEKLCQYSDVILGLCPDTKEVVESLGEQFVDKLKIVLHPNYIYNYDIKIERNVRDIFNISEKDLVFLFFGAVSPYKNIEMLIDIFKNLKKDKVKLLIAGNPCSKEYENELILRIAGSSNIIHDFKYIPNDKVVEYYNAASIVVLPYNKESSLNSGAVYLSFSLKRTVICPDIGTIKALQQKDFVFYYNYSTQDENKIEVKKLINKVCQDFERSPQSIYAKGKQAFNYVARLHSDEIISKQYGDLYRSLMSN